MSRRPLFLLGLASFATVIGLACSSTNDAPAPPADADAGDDAAPPPSGSSSGGTCGPGANCVYPPDAAPYVRPGPPTFCGSVPATWHDFSSLPDIESLIERRWLVCGDSVLGVANEAGLELHADGTYTVLVRDADGGLVASSDPFGTGTFTVNSFAPDAGYASGASFQVDLTSGNQFGPLLAFVVDSPPMMLVEPDGKYLRAYVPADDDGWTPVAAPQPPPGLAEPPPAACISDAGAPLVDAGADAAADAAEDGDAGGAPSGDAGPDLAGDWIYCDGRLPSEWRPDLAGLRLGTDGIYEVLVWDGAGALAPATDIFEMGPYGAFDGVSVGSTFVPIFEFDCGPACFDSLGGALDSTTLPNRLVFRDTSGNETSSFVRREITGL